MSTNPTTEPTPNIKKTAKRAGLFTAVGAAATIALAACAPNVGAEPKPTTTQSAEASQPSNENLDLQEQLEAAIAARPAEGTPEYYAQFESLALPDASVTDPAEISTAFGTALFVELPKMIIEDAPGKGDDEKVTDWQFEGDGRTVDSLVQRLDVNYFMDGFMTEIYGEGYDSDPAAQETVRSTFLPEVTFIVTGLLADGNDNSKLELTNTTTVLAQAPDFIQVSTAAQLAYSDETISDYSGVQTYRTENGKWYARTN